MTAAPQMSGPYPVTLRDWECTLTKALLRADAGNADAIRSFEITPETLAKFCGLGSEHAVDAERAFQSAIVNYPHLTWCLKNGRYVGGGAEVPNCMAILAFSLLVDSLLDGDYEDAGQYRTKVRQWLGIDRSFMQLRGVAIMWEQLADWLNAKVREGAPFRRLVLPQIPATWTHIGYTRYLSFPTKRDLRVLRKLIERNPKSANDPVTLVRILDPIVHSSAVSFGLKDAFDDFRIALRSGVASVDHRFWRLVGRAREMAGAAEAPLVELWMEFDEDGARSYRVKSIGASSMFSTDVGAAALTSTVIESPNLGPSVRRGVLFFGSSGLASWSATGELPRGVGPFHLAIADRHAYLGLGAIAIFEKSGSWHVTKEPMPSAVISDILERLGIGDTGVSVRVIGLVDGVHIGKAWLGQPRFLPRIDGAVGAIDVRSMDANGAPSLSCAAGRLTASEPVDGEFAFSDPVTGWSRRASFLPAAEVHAELDGACYSLPEAEEWRLGKVQMAPQPVTPDLVWENSAYSYQDVIEALYASSRSGIGEGEAVALCDRAVSRCSWEFLRALQEATFFDVRPRLRWRGHVLTLTRPILNEMRIGGILGVVVSGAVPVRSEADFRRTVELQGGRPFRRLVDDSFAPALLGAVEVDPARIAEALGWPIAIPATCPDGTLADRLCETKVLGDAFQLASSWDWKIARFRRGGRGDGPVSLTRLVHPGARDHDLYRVNGEWQRTFTSRYAAIIDAHAQAGKPLFQYVAGRVRRIAGEGALPIEVARALRLRTLKNGGASAESWEYEVAPRDGEWLAGLLPGMISDLPVAAKCGPALQHLRGRGARRPIWTAGGVAI